VTPHALRRTFASILAVCDVSPRRAISADDAKTSSTAVRGAPDETSIPERGTSPLVPEDGS
jgi:hypothetical protein